MKQNVMVILWMIVFCIGGCAQSLPPHEEFNLSIKKSLDSTGFNYSLKNRITRLSIPEKDIPAGSAEKRSKYHETALDVVKGFSLNADGAVDTKSKKSEVLYDLHYDKDNVEVSIKLPMLVDYNTQTIYVGTSLLNTILETVYPDVPTTKGKFIRININELLKENSENVPELSKIINKNNPKNIDTISSAVKAGILKSVGKLNDTCFSDQLLTESDRKAGVKRRIRVNLGHNDSVAIVVDLVDSIVQALFQDGIIDKKEYAELLTLTDKQTINGLADKFVMTLVFDIGIGASGFVNRVEGQLDLADKEGTYQLGLSNVSTFSSYNAPLFSMSPETSGIIEFKKVMDAIKTDKEKAKEPKTPLTSPDAPGDSNSSADAIQGDD